MMVILQLEELRNIAERSDGLKDAAQSELRRIRKELDEYSATTSKLTALVSC
jgi:hypothetical protein